MTTANPNPSPPPPGGRPPYSPNKVPRNLPMALAGVAVSVLYLANLTFGVIEIPDNLPLVGNLDEVFFSGLLFASLSRLGIRLPGYLDRPKK